MDILKFFLKIVNNVNINVVSVLIQQTIAKLVQILIERINRLVIVKMDILIMVQIKNVFNVLKNFKSVQVKQLVFNVKV